MSDLLAELFAHDPGNRGVNRHALANGGLRASHNVSDLAAAVTRIAGEVLGATEKNVARELAEFFTYRSVFLLLPEKCIFGEPELDKPIIRSHLEALGITPSEELVSAVKFFCQNFRAKRLGEARKASIGDVYMKSPRVYSAIVARQNGRCAVCGLRLTYGENMHLDHVLPWHLGDDPEDGSNWQFLCETCNRGKGVLPHYALSPLAANWMRPDQASVLREDVRYAVLIRDGQCTETGRLPTQTELTVVKRIASGCWVLDNLRAVAVSA